MNYSLKHKLRILALFVSLSMSVGNAVAIETLVTTWDAWTGTSFGEPQLGENIPGGPQAFATWGQTFTAPSDTPAGFNPALFSFIVWMDKTTPNPLNFEGYVMQWDGHRAIGPVLYDSGPLTLSSEFWASFTFDPMFVILAPGQQYVFIFSASGHLAEPNGRADISSVPTDVYPGGNAVFLDNGADISRWTTEDWVVAPGHSDTAFRALFTEAVAPDPPNTIILVIGAAFLVLAAVQRKHMVAKTGKATS